MRLLLTHLLLKPILIAKILKVKRLISTPIGFTWLRLLFTESERQMLKYGFRGSGKKNPSISIIIIHHNTSRFSWLIECINSLKSQIFSEFEIVIITNYEFPSNLSRILKNLNVMRIYFFENSHPSQARNFGVGKCNSELVMFVDDDNLLLPWHVLFLVNAYHSDSEASIFLGSFMCFQNRIVTGFPLRYPVTRRTLVLGDPSDVSSIAIKKSSFDLIHWDDAVLSENWAFLIDALDVDLKLHQVSAPLSLHRKHFNSRSQMIKRPLVPKAWFKKYRNCIDWGYMVPDSISKAKLLKVIFALRKTSDY